MTNLYEDLSKPFSDTAERQINKGGTLLTYIPQAEVVNRLNRVFGVDGWSLQVLYVGINEKFPDTVIAHVRLTATTHTATDDGLVTKTFARDGVGGQPIKMRKEGKGPVDLGDEFKGAVSDALKKAATLMGVALYLSRDDDAMDEESAPQPHPGWPTFKEAVDWLDEVAKGKLKEAWTVRTKGERKLTATTVTDDDMDWLKEQVLAAALGGEFVDPA